MYAPFAVPEGAVLTVDEIRERHFDLLVAANTKKIAPDSFDRSIEIFHGMSFRNRAIALPANGANDHYFVLGPYMRRRLSELGILATDDPRVVEVGFPKTDRLLDGTLDRAVLRAHGLDGRRPVLLYAPTGAKPTPLDDGRGGDPAAGGGGGLRPARQAARPSQAPDRLVRPPRPARVFARAWCASRTSS